ncbi:pyridoxal-dependent decarboxylase [Ilumatobacter sp.]|uniref:pyridoxal-dependent decarboxylase n=1 Tax=Ilumatobacter sp. TaxID=1967498 RepID=UPI003B518D41
MTADEFRSAGHALIDWIADHLEGSGDRDVASALAPGDVRAALAEHPPTEPEPFDAVMADVERVVVPGITGWQHPGWFAYFPANNSYPSILGELLSAGLGVQGMSWVTSPACTELETLVLDWMLELLDLPTRFRSTSEHGGGVIQGSASEATLVAILSARHRATEGAVNADGDTTRLVAYATDQAHSSVEKGLRIAGIGAERLRRVDHDERFAMRPDALATAVRADRGAGLVPFFVTSSHGTTSSMAFDPTPEIGQICRREHLWLHVDGAMAGIAALAPEHRAVNAGLELADSYCTNPHKWMGVNFDCTTYWTADRAHLLGALSILPEYLRSAAAESGAVIDYRDWQIPLGRRFRALKLWFAIRCTGIEQFRSMIRGHVALAQELASWVDGDDRFEIVAPHPLSLVCLARTGETTEVANRRTDELIDGVNASGRAFVTRTVLDGRSVLRVSIGARATTRDHVVALWDLLRELA